MRRRDFLKSAGAVTGGVFAGLSQVKAQSAADGGGPSGPQPNILFILVDELRYPTVFPTGISNEDEFLAKFMPNLHTLWKTGVKFGNYHTAANACTPARGTLISGLYSQQSWLLTTILAKPAPKEIVTEIEPVLNPAFPTYGSLLRKAGYQTPYFGKWHVSIPQQAKGGLDAYGFDYRTYPDPTGSNLQGTYGGAGLLDDADTANDAIQYLKTLAPGGQPWCLTVSFINPHDKEFFPAGTEFQTVTDLFSSSTANPDKLKQQNNYSNSAPVSASQNALSSPPSYGYPAVPPNWESAAQISAAGKPTTQVFIRQFQELVWGGVTDETAANTPADRTVAEYCATDLGYGVAKMEYTYWQRALDSYTQIMGVVDQQIGAVLDALQGLPSSIVENTVVVFTSDHGEYAGAHGLVQGKLGTVYEEAWRVPLIVVDPTGRFTKEVETIRTGLASSVDLSTMLVSLAYGGSRSWMTGSLGQIYGDRLDMVAMLGSASAPGRPYVLYATDEIAPNFYNFNDSPTHILGLRTQRGKLGVSANWFKGTSRIDPNTAQLEYYDYSTASGRLELTNTAATDPEAARLFRYLLTSVIPNELQKRLPPPLILAQEESKVAHLLYRALVENLPLSLLQDPDSLKDILGYGADF